VDGDGSAVNFADAAVDVVTSLPEAVQRLQSGRYQGVSVWGQGHDSIRFLLESGGLLEELPEAVVLLDLDLHILWYTRQLTEFTGQSESLVGQRFYEAFGTPEILGPDFCPFHTAIGSGESAQSRLRVGEKTYFEVHAAPVMEGDADEVLPSFLLVTVRDVSGDMAQQQKLSAIYQAGLELGDLQLQDVLEMTVEERIELLKSKILHYTQDLLEFDTVEIRLIDETTNVLEPLLAVGMEPDAAGRKLFVSAVDNGVTGFVAATGRSYLCEDTTSDPLYLRGAPDARSSLTVPLIMHEKCLGTFNVESPRAGAFTNNDLQFLELFSREVAIALNTLDLLEAEKGATASESTSQILREVAPSVDQILNDTYWILERYIGHDQQVTHRLQNILQHTRNIREQIQHVGETIATTLKKAPAPPWQDRPLLKGKRVLVVDSDAEVRKAAHAFLGRYGCSVETAHDGEEAMTMIRQSHYDAVLTDIRLPDMNGAECYERVREIHEHLPIILMTGFGYDPTHSIVRARQMGCESVLFKPFRLEQLLSEVEKAVAQPRPVSALSST
jgi:CheY-like chemotaxis protein/putative methionine-R-sulfoxide reductase with GAF domain